MRPRWLPAYRTFVATLRVILASIFGAVGLWSVDHGHVAVAWVAWVCFAAAMVWALYYIDRTTKLLDGER